MQTKLTREDTIALLRKYNKEPFHISFADGIFALQPMFSYGQRSKCADLLNSYKKSYKERTFAK